MSEQEGPLGNVKTIEESSLEMEDKLYSIYKAARTKQGQELFGVEAGLPAYPPRIKPRLGAQPAFEISKSLGNTQLTQEQETRANQVFIAISSILPPQEELDRIAQAPDEIKPFYLRPEVVQGIRIMDLLMDSDEANITKLWATLPPEQYEVFLSKLRAGELPSCLFSDEEMLRLREDLDKPATNTSGHETTRNVKSAARERLVDLALSPEYYLKDENDHAITPQIGGARQYEFDPDINLAAVFDRLYAEFPQG